jgi:ArsR family transcriptional regulator
MGTGTSLLTRYAKAIASPVRIRALHALKKGELGLCQLSALFGMADSTVCTHMSVLRDVGLVQSRRDGRSTHYSLPAERTAGVAAVLELVDMSANDPLVREDAARIGE